MLLTFNLRTKVTIIIIGYPIIVSPGEIADFLERIGLREYAGTFMDANIDGELLTDIIAMSPEILSSNLRVVSPLHQMKIMHLFPREMKGTGAKYSNDHLTQFLLKNSFNKCIPLMKENGIDGDMILEVDKEWMHSVLQEIGITPMDSLKILKGYKEHYHAVW